MGYFAPKTIVNMKHSMEWNILSPGDNQSLKVRTRAAGCDQLLVTFHSSLPFFFYRFGSPFRTR